MKRTLIAISAALLLLTGCSKKTLEARIIENQDGSVSITRIDEDGKAVLFNTKYEGSKNVTKVNAALSSKANPVTVDLSDYDGRDLEISLSCEMLIKITDRQLHKLIKDVLPHICLSAFLFPRRTS